MFALSGTALGASFKKAQIEGASLAATMVSRYLFLLIMSYGLYRNKSCENFPWDKKWPLFMRFFTG